MGRGGWRPVSEVGRNKRARRGEPPVPFIWKHSRNTQTGGSETMSWTEWWLLLVGKYSQCTDAISWLSVLTLLPIVLVITPIPWCSKGSLASTNTHMHTRTAGWHRHSSTAVIWECLIMESFHISDNMAPQGPLVDTRCKNMTTLLNTYNMARSQTTQIKGNQLINSRNVIISCLPSDSFEESAQQK